MKSAAVPLVLDSKQIGSARIGVRRRRRRQVQFGLAIPLHGGTEECRSKRKRLRRRLDANPSSERERWRRRRWRSSGEALDQPAEFTRIHLVNARRGRLGPPPRLRQWLPNDAERRRPGRRRRLLPRLVVHGGVFHRGGKRSDRGNRRGRKGGLKFDLYRFWEFNRQLACGCADAAEAAKITSLHVSACMVR